MEFIMKNGTPNFSPYSTTSSYSLSWTLVLTNWLHFPELTFLKVVGIEFASSI